MALTEPGWPRPSAPDRKGKRRPVAWITAAPEFAQMDPKRGRRCMHEKLCQVCGEAHEPGADVVIFLDGRPVDAETRGKVSLRDGIAATPRVLHLNIILYAIDGAFMHERCGKLAATYCPRLRQLRRQGALFGFIGPIESLEFEPADFSGPKVAMFGGSAKPWLVMGKERVA